MRGILLSATFVVLCAFGYGGYLWQKPSVITSDTGVKVLVSRFTVGGSDAGLGGTLSVVGDRCLGITAVESGRQRVVIWPHGTKIASEHPLTIRSEGRSHAVGDVIDAGGGEVGRPGPDTFYGSRIPASCLSLGFLRARDID